MAIFQQFFLTKRAWYWPIGSILLLWLTNSLAVDSVETLAQLKALETRIQQLQAQMLNTRTEYDKLLNQLKHQEENIGEVAGRLEVLHGALNDKQNTLTDLQQKRKKQYTLLDTQRRVLARQIRDSYLMGHQDYLKLWLNQEDPFTLGRLLAYYEYFNRARTRQITTIKQILQNIQFLEQSINLETTQLQQLVADETAKKTQLHSNYQERQIILVQLASTLKNQEKELNRLLEDKRHLETLLGAIGEIAKNIPQPPGPQIDFATLKSQLSYPVAGQIVNQFGQRLVGNLTWQGLLISANLGEKVHAIAAGRVIFAQWFRHLGLLIILDHGNNYMSLYAHNQKLYSKTGEWVETGHVIAAVGNSGGRQTPGLYFEIRYQGTPVDPLKWLKRRY